MDVAIGSRTLWTMGYGAWPVAVRVRGMTAALQEAGVTLVVDVRLNPCASSLKEDGPYGPKPWSLQIPPAGIVGLLDAAGVGYEWIAELGNPQRQDPAMAILRAQLHDTERDWPVRRGLARLADRINAPGARVALLCACEDPMSCHRNVIAEAAVQLPGRFPMGVRIHHLGPLTQQSARKNAE